MGVESPQCGVSGARMNRLQGTVFAAPSFDADRRAVDRVLNEVAEAGTHIPNLIRHVTCYGYIRSVTCTTPH